MSLTNLKNAVGNINAYFGTSKSRGLGGVIQSHNHTLEAEEATAQDENGETCFVVKYNKSVKGTIELLTIGDIDADAARKNLTVGSTFTIPTNKGLREVEGLPIIDSIEESTSNGEVAKFTISYTVRPNITTPVSNYLISGDTE